MDEAIIVKIQYLYIDALELLERKEYYLALQQLEVANTLYDDLKHDQQDDSHRIAIDLHLKLDGLLKTINNYLYNTSDIKVTLTPEEQQDIDNHVVHINNNTSSLYDNNDNSDEFELHLEPIERPFNIMDYFQPCFLPLQRSIKAFLHPKRKMD